MENMLKTQIIQALELVANPDLNKRTEAERFLNEANIANQEFFNQIMSLIIDPDVQDSQRIQSAVVLKTFTDKHWTKLLPDIQNLIKSRILEVLASAKSLKTGKLVADALYPIVLKEIGTNWATFEQELYANITSSAQNPDRMYFSLMALLKLVKTQEIASDNADKADNTVATFFPMLEHLFSSLVSSPLNAQSSAFISLLTKIYFRANRFRVSKYLKQHEKCDIWMTYFVSLIEYKDPQLKNARKWVCRSLIHLFRNYFAPSSSNNDKKNDHEFFNHWSSIWGPKFVEAFVVYLYNYNPDSDEEAVVFNISRCFFHIPKNPEIAKKYRESFLSLFKDSLFRISLLTDDNVETYNSDPIEYFKQNDDFTCERNLREAAVNIVTTLATEGFYNDIMEFILAKLRGTPSVLEKENCYYYIQKLKNAIIKEATNGTVVLEAMFKEYVLTDAENPHGILRCRAVNLIETYCTYLRSDEIISQCVQVVSRRLEDPDMPVRSFAAVALDKLLSKAEVVEMIRPHIKSVLVIFVKLLNECDHERLVNSLTGIFESYKKEIGPYVLDLVVSVKNLILKIYNKDNGTGEADMEEGEFSILSAYTALKELLKAEFDSTLIPQIFGEIEQLFEKAFEDQDLEVVEEILDLVNLCIFRSSRDNIIPQLWQFYEFLCYSSAISIPLPQTEHPQNNYFNYLAVNRENFREFGTAILRCLRNYIYKGKAILLSGQDEQGHLYLDLLLKALEESKEYTSDILEDSMKMEVSMVEAVLAFEMKDFPDVLKSRNLIANCLQSTSSLNNDKEYVHLSNSVIVHNIGLLCITDFTQTITSFMGINNFIGEWVKKHLLTLTYRTRKASTLGLLNVVRHYKEVQNMIGDLESLLVVLMKEIVVLDLQRQREAENMDFDMDDLDDDDDDDEDDSAPTPATVMKETTVDDIDDRLAAMDNEFMMESETLLNFDWEYILETLQNISEFQVAKEVFLQLEQECPGIMSQVASKLPQEISDKAKALLN